MKKNIDLDLAISTFLALAKSQLPAVTDDVLLERLSDIGSGLTLASLKKLLKGEYSDINTLAEVTYAFELTLADVLAACEPIGGQKMKALADTLAKAK